MKLRRSIVKKSEPPSIREPGPCLNCGTQMGSDDLFCPHCGQKRLGREDMSFRHLIGESFLDYFHFDSKFFRTILPLIFKPGHLTLEFMKGKRKTYVAPFRLFLVISIIYFLLLPFSKEPETDGVKNVKTGTAGPYLSKKTSRSRSIKFTFNNMPVSNAGQDSVRNDIDSMGLTAYINKKFPQEGSLLKFFTGQAYKIMLSSGQSISTVIEHTASKMVFLLIPVIALLLKLLYIRRKRLYYEHLIFTLHTHAFFFLLLILSTLLEYILPGSMKIMVLITLVYTFFAMKKYYGQRVLKTLVKFGLLSLSYLIIALPVFFLLLILVVLLFY